MPSNIFLDKDMDLPEAMTERELVEHINELGNKNKVFTSYIGMASTTTLPHLLFSVMYLRTLFLYLLYTLSGGDFTRRLEALFNFQTVITELTALPLTTVS